MFDLVPFRRNGGLRKRNNYFDHFFDDFFNDDFFTPMNIGNAFRVDVKENENEYLIEADLPGIKKDAISLEYENNYLTISAKRDDSLEDKTDNYVRRERRYGEFRRKFYVDNVDENNISASFENGVLKVIIPKREKNKPNGRKINIK